MFKQCKIYPCPPPPRIWSPGVTGGMWAQLGEGQVCQAVLGSTEVYIETTYVV